MAGKIKAMWTNKDIRNRILFTLFAFLVYRLGSAITVPDVNTTDLVNGLGENSLFAMLNLLGGGGLEQFSVFALGVTPYITASIIIQLLSMDVIPHLTELSKAGANGRKTLDKYTRYLAVVFAFVQSFSLVYGFSKAYTGLIVGGVTISKILYIATIFAAGSMFLVWIGDQISMKGIGNGISIILFAGILSRVPSMVSSMISGLRAGTLAWWAAVLVVLGILALIVLITWVNGAERRIPVQYAKRQVGRKMYGGQASTLPMKVNMSGVLPIIFAQSIAMIPSTIAAFCKQPAEGTFWYGFLNAIDTKSVLYMIFYFLMIIAFSYFYATIQFNPVEISNNLKKNGGFIPGFRPGKPTTDFIKKVLNKVTLFGAIYLGVVAILPLLIGKIVGNSSLSIGGTSVIIVVGVALETVQALESQMLMRQYKGFLE